MKKKIFSFILLSTLLTSCNGDVSLYFNEYTPNSPLIETHFNVNEENYYQVANQGSIKFPEGLSINGVNEISSLYDLKKASEKKLIYSESLDKTTTKELKMLIVPVLYNDSPSFNDPSKQEEIVTKIQNAFFGQKSHNAYYSVSEYYYRSSYGQILLTGEVTPFYYVNKNARSLDNDISTAQKIVADVSGWLRSNEYPNSNFDLSSYDDNKDNYIDGVYLVYDYPSYHANQGEQLLFWQVTDQIADNTRGFEEKYTNPDNILTSYPRIRDYSWSSTDCMVDSNKTNSQYFIHETGHLFGLDDYYNTGSGYYQPTGFMDMMDYNLGDHTSFSKYLLDWTTPYVVTDEGKITIKSFSETGQFVLVPANLSRYQKHNSPYDEYLLLEFFTPTGLNKSSSFSNYLYTNKFNETGIFAFPKTYGVKVYHVDARLAVYNNQSLYADAHCMGMLEDITSAQFSAAKAVYYRYDNETSLNSITTPVLYHLLEKNGENTFYNGDAASDYTLFKYGDTFGVDTFTDFRFHGGESLNYTFEITGYTTKSVEITFNKK